MKIRKLIFALFLFSLVILFSQCKRNCTPTDRCNLIPDSGPCLAFFTRYYYDKNEKKCKTFIYGGCAGMVPFETLAECEKECRCK